MPADNFSIIIPTFHEAKNIPQLIQRISQIDVGERRFEVLVIDDNSQDGIEAIMQHLETTYPFIKLIVRHEPKSLSTAALAGFDAAQYPIVVLMDADLSHPPEKIPALLAALQDPAVDFVLGSRYVAGGSTDEVWPRLRKFTSYLSALITRVLLFAPLQDPLSGFFAVRKTTLQAGDPLRPIGWKIGLEIILKCRCSNIKEIPIHFSQRLHGQSKLNWKVAWDYCRHLKQLIFYRVSSWL